GHTRQRQREGKRSNLFPRDRPAPFVVEHPLDIPPSLFQVRVPTWIALAQGPGEILHVSAQARWQILARKFAHSASALSSRNKTPLMSSSGANATVYANAMFPSSPHKTQRNEPIPTPHVTNHAYQSRPRRTIPGEHPPHNTYQPYLFLRKA